MIINILTFSKVYNRGANMQAYALMKYLENRGAEVEFIDIQLPLSSGLNWHGRVFQFFQNVLADKFRKQMHFHFTRRYLDGADLKNNPPKADVYVVGSDQVWNPSITKNLGALTYFFDFLPAGTKKVSYAASIGDADWKYDELSYSIKKELQHFSAISVREDSARAICKNKFDMDAEVVLDPTLLLSRKDLIDIVGSNAKTNKSQTFVYLLYSDKNVLDIVSKLHALTGNQKIVGLSKSLWSKLTRFYTIPSWLKQINSSKLIVTNSFHCMVMAILLHKDFFVIPPYPGRETRMVSLLSRIGLTHRYINTASSLEKKKDLVNAKIDYEKVDYDLSILRKQSEEFINSNIL